MRGDETESVFVEEFEVANDHELNLRGQRRKRHLGRGVCLMRQVIKGELSSCISTLRSKQIYTNGMWNGESTLRVSLELRVRALALLPWTLSLLTITLTITSRCGTAS